jgi:hypothetical protein
MNFWFIVSIQVDKQGIDIFKLEKSCIYPLRLNSVIYMKSSIQEEWFWVSNMENSKTLPKASFFE